GLGALQVLGAPALLVEVAGDFEGMGAEPVEDALLLGLVCPLGEDSLFVKLVGPAGEVRAERLRFLQFVGALRWEDAP
ncbi:MAG TPA: hypothetical protein VJP77_07090, partial [Planctomycetota bacterium]|nr:hypothetical protein [Planctomycetota bacterium]